MRKIKSYSGDAFNFHKKVLNAKKTGKTKTLVTSLEGIIKAQFECYDTCFKEDTLQNLEAAPVTDEQKDALLNMYSFQMRPFQELLAVLTTDEHNRVSKLCPNCTINNVQSLDHCIPKTEFPEFSDNPKNLMQCCMTCNGKKSKIWRSETDRIFLNLFIDEIPTQQYLFVKGELIEGIPIFSFRLEQSAGIDNLLYRKIVSHYNGLDLLNRFAENSPDIIDELIFIIKSSVQNSIPPDKIKKSVLSAASMLQEKFGTNYWKALLYIECVSNKEIYDTIISNAL
ncbi:MAG: hypothetical protein ACI3ZQ_00740 [Candidatus Cryptobacteroides sp.]